MTQMLLFDSPVALTETTSPRAGNDDQVESTNLAAQLTHDSGMHHMGDLARLVLLRYELVAKRREQIAKRKAASRPR